MKTDYISKVTAGLVFTALGAVSAVQAAPVLSVSAQGWAAAEAAEAQFLSLLRPGTAITEDFESFTSGVQTPALTTAVGKFTQTPGPIVPGADCGTTCGNGLGVLNSVDSPFQGRFPAPAVSGNSQWLDSYDATTVTFDIFAGNQAVGFYMTDPNDVSGRLEIAGVSFNFSDIFGGAQPDGQVYYISLFDEAGLGTIKFHANAKNDGFGIDTVTIGQVPEPGTLALFGLGLVGVGLMRRRKA